MPTNPPLQGLPCPSGLGDGLHRSDQVGDRAGEAGAADPGLVEIEIGNLSRAVLEGDLSGQWQLGAAIGAWLGKKG